MFSEEMQELGFQKIKVPPPHRSPLRSSSPLTGLPPFSLLISWPSTVHHVHLSFLHLFWLFLSLFPSFALLT